MVLLVKLFFSLTQEKVGYSIAAVAQEYLWLDWFLVQWRRIVLGFCFPMFGLKCYACYAWKINNLFKEYVNRPTLTRTPTHTHIPQKIHIHRLFVQGRPLLRKNDLFSVSSAPHITDGLNDWAFCVFVCVRVPVCVCVCVWIKWTEQSWHLH